MKVLQCIDLGNISGSIRASLHPDHAYPKTMASLGKCAADGPHPDDGNRAPSQQLVMRSALPLAPRLLPCVQDNLTRKRKHHGETMLGNRHGCDSARVRQAEPRFCWERSCEVWLVAGTGQLKETNFTLGDGLGRRPPEHDFGQRERMSPVIGPLRNKICNSPTIYMRGESLALLVGESVDRNHYPFQHRRLRDPSGASCLLIHVFCTKTRSTLSRI